VWEGEKAIPARPRAGKAALEPIAIPEWLRRPAPVEARPPRPLAPSQIVDDLDSAPPPTPEMREAARRGTLLHSLFERLPGVDEADRKGLALHWLAQLGVEKDIADEIVSAACSLIADPTYAGLFDANSLAEVPIAATVPDDRVIAGTVDRLCIGDDLVRVIDFKTGRGVPADLASVPPAHRAQMEAYSQALKVIFPERRVEASLLYTAGPRLITLPG
jgi:ATP-dependent helicase/nuclease subunit A